MVSDINLVCHCAGSEQHRWTAAANWFLMSCFLDCGSLRAEAVVQSMTMAASTAVVTCMCRCLSRTASLIHYQTVLDWFINPDDGYNGLF